MVFIEDIKQREGLFTEFDEELWNAVIEKVVVYSKEKIRFILQGWNGIRVEFIRNYKALESME